MPKPNRPLVRDGRLQAPKKRTDRSYLRPGPSTPAATPAPDEAEAPDEIVESAAELAPLAEPVAAFAPPAPAPTPAARAARPQPAPRLPTTVRALQQQGVRKRRDVDLTALAKRDTSYAYHELRRIAVLATMVVVTLIVLWIVLR